MNKLKQSEAFESQQVIFFISLSTSFGQFYEETTCSQTSPVCESLHDGESDATAKSTPPLSIATGWSVSYSVISEQEWVICTVTKLSSLGLISNRYSLAPRSCVNPLLKSILHWFDANHCRNNSYIYVKRVYFKLHWLISELWLKCNRICCDTELSVHFGKGCLCHAASISRRSPQEHNLQSETPINRTEELRLAYICMSNMRKPAAWIMIASDKWTCKYLPLTSRAYKQARNRETRPAYSQLLNCQLLCTDVLIFLPSKIFRLLAYRESS